MGRDGVLRYGPWITSVPKVNQPGRLGKRRGCACMNVLTRMIPQIPAMQTFDDFGGIRDIFLTLERTQDASVIRSVLHHPDVLTKVWDGAGDPPIPIHDSIYHLVAKVDGEVAGLITFMPVNSITWNPHVNIIAQGRGLGTELVKRGLEYMFSRTPCRKVVAFPPAPNIAMIRVFEKCGFQREGYSPNSFEFKGETFNRVLLGIGKG